MSKPYDIQHEQSLILNFFSGEAYFVFENDEEIDCFLRYINMYDKRFSAEFEKKSEIKSTAWMYQMNLHGYRLEWSDKEDYFKKYEMRPVSFSVVRKYIEQFLCIGKIYSNVANKIGEIFNGIFG